MDHKQLKTMRWFVTFGETIGLILFLSNLAFVMFALLLPSIHYAYGLVHSYGLFVGVVILLASRLLLRKIKRSENSLQKDNKK